MRLIDADKLRKDILDLPNCYNGFSDTYDKACIIDMIDEQPTVDAEPVVLCKKCNRFERNNTKKGEVLYCYYHEMNIKEDDFCSWGERKEDAKID